MEISPGSNFLPPSYFNHISLFACTNEFCHCQGRVGQASVGEDRRYLQGAHAAVIAEHL